MRRLVLSLPVIFLALSSDRALPEPRLSTPPGTRRVESLDAALRGLAGRNEGRLGRPGNALNLVFVGRFEALREAMSSAGWTELPSTIRGSLAAGLGELLSGRPLAAAPPMNDYWLAGRRQGMNWSIPIRVLSARHHFRLWDTGLRDERDRTIWWGSGDTDLRIRWRDLSHVPDPETDHERDFVAESLRRVSAVKRISYAALPQIPRAGVNDKGYPFRNDGRAAVIELRPESAGTLALRN